MNFVFPKNYTFKSKLLGFIDYSTAILNVSFAFILYSILNIFIKNIVDIIPIFIPIFIPFFLITIFSVQKESFLDVAKYLLKYFLSTKLYLYEKTK